MSEEQKKGRSSPLHKGSKNAVQDLLVKGEEIVMQAEISPAIYWKSFAVLLASFLLALVAVPLGIVLAVAALLMFIHATIKKEILMFVLTNKRILVRYGILQVDVVDMHFSKVESIELERMIPGYILGYASLIVMGTGQRFIGIPYVKNARELRRAYNGLVLEAEEGGEPAESGAVSDSQEN